MKKKKRSVTLIEIMIVIILIGLIGGTLAYNMRGSLDEGKAFKTEQNINRLYDVLMLEYGKGEKSLEEIKAQHAAIVAESPFVKGSSILVGGWKEPLQITIVDGDFVVSSEKLDAYRKKPVPHANEKKKKSHTA